MSQEETGKENKEPQRELSKQSSATTRKDQASELDNLVDSLPPEILEVVRKVLERAGEDPAKLRQITAQFKYSSYRGELPPAEVLGEYDREYPGSAEWVLQRITARQNKKLDIAQLQAEGQERRAGRAQWFGLAVTIVGVLTSGIAYVLTGGYIFPSILAIGSLGGPTALATLARVLQKQLGIKEEN